MAYVSEYGNYGSERILTFNDDDLTTEQWETLDILPDQDKMSYVDAILNNEPLDRWEE